MKREFAAVSLLLMGMSSSQASRHDILGPPGSGKFGAATAVLPNGNVVITDPEYSTPSTLRVGAVFLYDQKGTLISAIVGSVTDDRVGDGGITVLTNGNFVVRSALWHNVGAITWGDAIDGVNGVVSALNSLVGERRDDYVGFSPITVLSNGNYVVLSPNWGGLQANAVGAATWGNGTAGVSGGISSTNSLVGTAGSDQVGGSATALPDGNYVVQSSSWSNGNSSGAGAATWGNGASGVVGEVSSANSLVGARAGDGVGQEVVVLKNGHYVVLSPQWHYADATAPAGAVTWGNGTVGVRGIVSESNSFVGTASSFPIGTSVTPLSNGNYVIGSGRWNNPTVFDGERAGAVTWSLGNPGITGHVSLHNSLVGDDYGQGVGTRIVALSNGNYVVGSSGWNDSSTQYSVGAVTWGNGATGTTGIVSRSNSLVGTSVEDRVGTSIVPLTNGNYVVTSVSWHNGSASFAGAATWGDGMHGTTGEVSALNSLVGTSTYDDVGDVTALPNGDYLVATPRWTKAATGMVGAVTLGNGVAGTSGAVSASNSLTGTSIGDAVGQSITLGNGAYLVASSWWDNGAIKNVGMVTKRSMLDPTMGVVSASSALVGSSSGDEIGFGGISSYANGRVIIVSPYWHDDASHRSGAITLLAGGGPVIGTINESNSVIGGVMAAGSSMVYSYQPQRDILAVGRPSENLVTIVKLEVLFANGFE